MIKAKETKEVTVDLDKVIALARDRFKNSEKGLGLQIVTGMTAKNDSKASDWVDWPDSSWHLMTSVRGLPFGRITQIAGRPDSGKSTHAMQFMSLAQKQGHIVVLWDTENKFSAKRFEKYFGGDLSNLALIKSKVILEGSDEVDAVVESLLTLYPTKKVLIVWDSVGGAISKSENALAKRSSRQMAEAAKDNGIACRGFVSLIEKFRDTETNEDRVAVLLINQVYADIKGKGQKEAGGQKVEFYSSIIIQLTRKAFLYKMRDGIKRKVGITVIARIKKNHLFDGEDMIAEVDLDITAGAILINKKSPVMKLVARDDQKSTEDFEEIVDDLLIADDAEDVEEE